MREVTSMKFKTPKGNTLEIPDSELTGFYGEKLKEVQINQEVSYMDFVKLQIQAKSPVEIYKSDPKWKIYQNFGLFYMNPVSDRDIRFYNHNPSDFVYQRQVDSSDTIFLNNILAKLKELDAQVENQIKSSIPYLKWT